MYCLATCDDDGRCFGFLRADETISRNPDNEIDKLMVFKKKGEANEKALQINLGHMLLPGEMAYRVAVVKI